MAGATSPSSFAQLPRCPACKNPMMSTPENKCPLCGHPLGEPEETGGDSTPFAGQEKHRYWKMVRWILLAGSYRLSYLSRTKRSKASAQFAGLNLFLVALGCGLLAVPDVGWKPIVDHGASWQHGYPQPSHSGWILVGKAARPVSRASDGVMVRLWWNPALWLMAVVANVLMALLLGMLILCWTRTGCERVLAAQYRGEDRFGAAIHYGTAHAPILLLAAVVYSSRVLHTLVQVSPWQLRWPAMVHVVPAFLIAGLGLFMLWFWYLRLAHTSPRDTQGRVARYFTFWAPIKTILIMGGWLAGQRYGFPHLASLLEMNF